MTLGLMLGVLYVQGLPASWSLPISDVKNHDDASIHNKA